MPRVARLQHGEAPRLGAYVGQRIRQARQEQGMTLAQVAGEELTRGFISAVELGRSEISLKALWLVARRLNKPMGYFLEGSDAAEAEGALAELVLDDAEAALRSRRAAEALQLVNEVEAPDELSSRKKWLHGCALIDLGRAREAIPLLEEALAEAETGEDIRHTVQVRYALMSALYVGNNFDEALVQLRIAHQQASTQLDDQALLGKITVAIGHIQYMQGQLDKALDQYARARQIFDTVNDLDNLAAVYTGMSRIHRQQGDLQAALRYSRLSLGIFEAKHNEREVAHELSNMAARYEELGKLDETLEASQAAVDRAQRSKSPDIESLARSTLAAVYLRLGRLQEARDEAQAARQIGGSETDLGAIDGVIVLAQVSQELGELEQADEFFRRALEALEATHFRSRYADIALKYSEVLRARGDMDEALTYAIAAAKALTGR